MEEKIYVLYEPSRDIRIKEPCIVFRGTEEQVDKFIGGKAQQLNYGLCRMWEHDGTRYYDCGPITYFRREE